jgi:hypothetical protein
MRRLDWIVVTLLSSSFASLPVHGAVLGSGAGGFTVHEEAEFAGAPAAAWKHLVDVGSWWNPKHTYSGVSSNLTLTLSAGGCWCEKLDNGGFVQHMQVVLVIPEKILRFTGGLGPLQGMGATGALTFTLHGTSPTATKVVAEYTVTGYARDGLSDVAGAVDEVLGEALRRFAAK